MKLLSLILNTAHRRPESAAERRRRLLREAFTPAVTPAHRKRS